MSNDPSGPRVRCPTCGDTVIWSTSAVWRPFCSKRCRLLDLGAWFGEEHAIPGHGPHDGMDGAGDMGLPNPDHGVE